MPTEGPLDTEYPLKIYLRRNRWIDPEDEAVRSLVATWSDLGPWATVQRAFEFARDEVKAPTGPRVVRTSADALRYGEGLCHTKAMLLTALVRALGIPAGVAYQRLAMDGGGHALRALTTIYMPNLGTWGRVDVSGSRMDKFSVSSMMADGLVHRVRPESGEMDYRANLPEPAPVVARSLEAYDDWTRIRLPDRL